MCFNESGFCHFAEKESLKGISVLRIEIQWFKSRLHKAQSRYGQPKNKFIKHRRYGSHGSQCNWK